MKPSDAEVYDIWCDRDCPHFHPYDHPYFNHCVWCSYQLRGLGYWDGTLADCLNRGPHEGLKRTEDMMNESNNRRE